MEGIPDPHKWKKDKLNRPDSRLRIRAIFLGIFLTFIIESLFALILINIDGIISQFTRLPEIWQTGIIFGGLVPLVSVLLNVFVSRIFLNKK